MIKRLLNKVIDKISGPFVFMKGYLKSYKKTTNEDIDYPIDIVVTWVDGSDEEWFSLKQYHQSGAKGGAPNSNGMARYRTWEHFKYWFRSIEKYAPWVNNVYFVTFGHIPAWLNVDSPKLKIVKHEDFIPEEYLPTFSSIPIEFNLHRIPGLSEHFIYFNDDVFLARPCTPDDFFVDGKPRISTESYLMSPQNNQAHDHILFSSMIEINKMNDIRAAIRKYPELWFSCKLKGNKGNFATYNNGYLSALCFTHQASPWKKSVVQSAWEKYTALSEVSKNKFRTAMDCNHLIFTAEHIFNGECYPTTFTYFGKCVNMHEIEKIKDIFYNKQTLMCCFIDGHYGEEDVERIDKEICLILESLFDKKSIFEN